MIDATMRIGDEVVVTIPKENRDSGYDPCPDGTKATVLGFSEIHYSRIDGLGLRPGVYVNRAWVNLMLEDGREHTESSGRLELVDQVEYDRRVTEFRQLQKANLNYWRDNKEFVRELPETPFWEGDKVRVSARLALTVVTGEMPPEQDPQIFTIVGIDYHHLDSKTSIGTKYPAYQISDKLGAGWNTSSSDDNMELVERGNVWKLYHNESLSFADLKEEASFFTLVGHTEEVRNPANGLYCWTKEEVLDAIKKGIVHGFSMSNGFFGSGPHIGARRFRNEELGARVAQATLQGFGLA